MTALTNAQRQAEHRAKKDATVADLAASVSKLLTENDDLKTQLTTIQNKLIEQEKASKKKIEILEKKLLRALEKVTEINVKNKKIIESTKK